MSERRVERRIALDQAWRSLRAAREVLMRKGWTGLTPFSVKTHLVTACESMMRVLEALEAREAGGDE
jgi:hypothetical protein